ncbi:hypothetical protein [Mycobacterium malmoense]|uniref:hypothetical protein n=1 Tax=Mycobacterium malmoense TaxID=1780 RepID=UPI0008F92C8F|nr:hypothetical protein [Mycobacterium malmoense]OIN80754.1 hypothetical protein BMG05_10425 [Mycobacterium malmoense]
MSLVTDKPQDIPTGNDIDNIPHDLLGPQPAVIRMSGKDLLVMETPPDIGDFVKIEITMRCKDDGRTLLSDGEIGHYRIMSFVTAKVTTEPYKPEPEPEPEPEPSLFDAPVDHDDEADGKSNDKD